MSCLVNFSSGVDYGCFEVEKNDGEISILIGDMILTPDDLDAEDRKRFEDCEKRGENRLCDPDDDCGAPPEWVK